MSKRALVSFILIAGSNLVLAAMTVILTRASESAAFGRYASVVALLTILTVPVVAGFDRMVIRSLASNLALQRYELVVGMLQRGRNIALGGSVAVALAIGAVGLVAAPDRELILPLFVGLVALPFAALSRLRQGALFGLERIALAQIPEAFVRPGLVIVLVAAVLVAYPETSFGALELVLLYLLGTIVAFLVGTAFLGAALPRELRNVAPRYETRAWVRESVALTALASGSAAMLHSPIVVLDMVSGPTPAAVYTVAMRIALVIPLPVIAANVILGPLVARMWALGETAALQQLLITAGRISFAAAVPAVVILAVGPRDIMALFGHEYVPGAGVLQVLVVGQLLTAAAGSAGLLLLMTGRSAHAATAQVAIAVASVPFVALGAHWAAAEGAAVAATIALVSLNVAWMLIARRLFGFAGTAFGRAR